jgi:acetyl esterase/lipase
MTVHTSPIPAAPGRLGQPDLSPGSDPRALPSLVSALSSYGLDAVTEVVTVSPDGDLADVLSVMADEHAGSDALFNSVPLDLPGDRNDVDVTTETITSFDGSDLTLYISRPRGAQGPLPGIMHSHGGGMTVVSTDNAVHRRWDADLAASGSVVILVDFRNAWTAAGHNPFPTGVEDCLAAMLWVDEHREDLGLSSLVLFGESGGGNLALATALLAKRRGRPDAADGIYADIPFISGGYGWDRERQLAELPSLVENNGYQVDTRMMSLYVRCYDPTGENAENPIAWPYHATLDDLRDLPPTVISVNELDPFRDEGIALARKLGSAGVEVSARVNLGLTHGATQIFRQAVAEAQRATIRDVAGFASDRARLRTAEAS